MADARHSDILGSDHQIEMERAAVHSVLVGICDELRRPITKRDVTASSGRTAFAQAGVGDGTTVQLTSVLTSRHCGNAGRLPRPTRRVEIIERLRSSRSGDLDARPAFLTEDSEALGSPTQGFLAVPLPGRAGSAPVEGAGRSSSRQRTVRRLSTPTPRWHGRAGRGQPRPTPEPAVQAGRWAPRRTARSARRRAFVT